MSAYVTLRRRSLKGFENYLYQSMKVVQEPVDDRFGQMALVEVLDNQQGQILADRAASGLMGARVFDTLEEAETYMLEWRE